MRSLLHRFAVIPPSVAALMLATSMSFAQTYHDLSGTIVPGVVPLIGCGSGVNCTAPVSSSNPLPISGSFSASLSGFAPGAAYAALAAGASSARVALPAGTVVVVYNMGANPACVLLGNSSVAATSSGANCTNDDFIPANGWYALTVGSNTYLAAIDTSAGTTSLELSGGAGLPTGAGGGSAAAAAARRRPARPARPMRACLRCRAFPGRPGFLSQAHSGNRRSLFRPPRFRFRPGRLHPPIRT